MLPEAVTANLRENEHQLFSEQSVERRSTRGSTPNLGLFLASQQWGNQFQCHSTYAPCSLRPVVDSKAKQSLLWNAFTSSLLELKVFLRIKPDDKVNHFGLRAEIDLMRCVGGDDKHVAGPDILCELACRGSAF